MSRYLSEPAIINLPIGSIRISDSPPPPDADDHRSDRSEVLSPAPMLIPELLSHIFLHCRAEHWSLDTMASDTAPLLIGQVCSFWRNVALASPRLWTSPNIVITHRREMHTLAALFKLFLGRSGTCLLQARFLFRMSGRKFDDYSPLFDLFLQHSHHWQEVELRIPLSKVCHLAEIKNRVPFLNKVSIHVSDDSPLQINRRHWDVLECAPRLTEFVARGLTHLYEPLLPWSQLRLLEHACVSVGECLEVALMSPHLVTWKPTIISGLAQLPLHPIPYTVAFLTQLRVISFQLLGTIIITVILFFPWTRRASPSCSLHRLPAVTSSLATAPVPFFIDTIILSPQDTVPS